MSDVCLRTSTCTCTQVLLTLESLIVGVDVRFIQSYFPGKYNCRSASMWDSVLLVRLSEWIYVGLSECRSVYLCGVSKCYINLYHVYKVHASHLWYPRVPTYLGSSIQVTGCYYLCVFEHHHSRSASSIFNTNHSAIDLMTYSPRIITTNHHGYRYKLRQFI